MGEAGRGEVLPCTCEVDSRSEGECAPCWLEVAVLFAMMTEVPLIGRKGECAMPVGWRKHVMVGARGDARGQQQPGRRGALPPPSPPPP